MAKSNTVELYERLFSQYGDSHKSLNWGSQDGQEIRFRILTEIADLAQKRILDVGCGLGHFADWLQKQGINVDYSGLDVTASLIMSARKRLLDCEFIEGDILNENILKKRSFDYVFASGIFYTYKKGAFEWQKDAIKRLWHLAEKGIAFNSLSTFTSNQEPDEYYAAPSAVLEYCYEMTPWVVLRHDYHLGDFTIYMTKQPR